MDAAAVTRSIPFSAWQQALGEPGVVLGGIDELDQAVRIILSTPLQSDAHRPDFGSDLQRYLDWPQNSVTPHLVRETFAALQRWEPRIEVVSARISFNDAQVLIDVSWRPRDTSTAVNTTRVSLPA